MASQPIPEEKSSKLVSTRFIFDVRVNISAEILRQEECRIPFIVAHHAQLNCRLSVTFGNLVFLFREQIFRNLFSAFRHHIFIYGVSGLWRFMQKYLKCCDVILTLKPTNFPSAKTENREEVNNP